MLAQMSNSKIFTKLDGSNACWQIHVDEEISKMLIFHSPNGRYHFLCMPYDILFDSNV